MKSRTMILTMFLAIVTLGAIVEFVVIINLTRVNSELYARRINSTDYKSANSQVHFLRREALSRAALYDQLIQKDFLLDGMVVNRNAIGEHIAICDSLLFSSIRFYSLTKLGFKNSADDAWQNILQSRIGGQWQRHPKCKKSLSRDMVMGVLVALSANPRGGTEVYRSMLAEIGQNWGFAGDGPFYVSWLSPGIASLLRLEAERRHIPFEEWPWNIKNSFSSIEYDTMFLEEGYVSHLAALGLWLELDHMEKNNHRDPRSLLGRMHRFLNSDELKNTEIDDQRRKWIASRLRSIHSTNIFYEILERKIYGDLNLNEEEQILNRLLSMPQFPPTRLPMDCDRDADYLWQRREGESISTVKKCGEKFNGVDFLFAAALLGVGSNVSNLELAPSNPVNLGH